MYSKHMYNTVESRSATWKASLSFFLVSNSFLLQPYLTFHFKCLVHENAFKHVWVGSSLIMHSAHTLAKLQVLPARQKEEEIIILVHPLIFDRHQKVTQLVIFSKSPQNLGEECVSREKSRDNVKQIRSKASWHEKESKEGWKPPSLTHDH